MLNMDDPVVKLIVEARVRMLFKQAFFGNLATKLHIVDATKWCRTAATDGKTLYYNREFVKSLKPDELLFLMGHEVMHVVYSHLGRKGHRDPKIYNMAADYLINYSLVKQQIGAMPKCGLFDERYTDSMSTEQIYADLMDRCVKVEMTLDEHLDLTGEEEEKKTGRKVTVTVMGDGDGPPKLTESDMEKLRNQLKADMINAAHAVGADNVPMGIRRMLDAFTDPVMDWRELLEMHIQSTLKDDYTFQRPSKRSWNSGCILPGQKFATTVDVAAAIDMSGSISEEQGRDFLSEIKGIMDTFGDFKLTLWTFDTQVYNPKVFTPQNIDELATYDIMGGGGTSFDVNWEFMKNPGSAGFPEMGEAIEPLKFVMFTDGFTGDNYGDEDWCDTLWIVHGNPGYDPPHGTVAHYSEREQK